MQDLGSILGKTLNRKERTADVQLDFDRDAAIDLVLQLMSIPGKSGNEEDVAEFIQRRLRLAGVRGSSIDSDSAHRRTLLRGQRGNLFLRLRGSVRGPRRLLLAHMDTVPICVGSRPVQRNGMVVSGDPTTGLGADDRAGVAVVLHAALEILRRKLPHPPLTFCWTVQEEVGLQGAKMMGKSRLGGPRMAFNWDGGAPEKLTVGATSGYRMKIDIHGVASHAGVSPELGVSAIAIAALAIADLQRNGWHGDIRQGKRRGTSNIGYIHGGEATNVVTDHVEILAEARSHDSRFRQRIQREIEQAFRRAARQITNAAGKTGSVTVNGHLDYDAFRLAANEPCVRAAESAVRRIGRDPHRAISNGGVDANWLVRHGIPTVTLGCGQLNAHMTSEALVVEAYLDACRVAMVLATATEG